MSTKTQKRVSLVLSIFLLLSLTFSNLSATPVHAGGPPSLFGDAGDTVPADQSVSPHAIRTRYLTVNTQALFNTAGEPFDTQQLPEITLNLFADTKFVGKVKQVKQDRWGISWTGRLKGVTNGSFYMVMTDDVFMAHVASPRGVYEVKFAGDNLYKAEQLDHDTFLDHAPGFEPQDLPNEPILTETDIDTSIADSGATIDILVAYTKAARLQAGSIAAMKALINLALLETNTSYANSGVNTRLRLVHIEEYTYNEPGDLYIDLLRLQNTTDNHFKTIHSLRNTYGADMVGLIVADGGPGYCGMAYDILATPDTAFQVTDNDCATGYYSFGHEFGHLQGARHDILVDPNTSPYAYGHGYVHTDEPSTLDYWRTVMAYANACGSCTRLPYWSNPNKNYLGDPMGDSQARNYQVLNATALTIANFRTVKISNDFNNNFNGTSTGWSAVNGTWDIYKDLHYYSTGQLNRWATSVRSGTFGDMTYEARMKRTGDCTGCSNGLIIRGDSSPLINPDKWWNKEYKFVYNNNGSFSIWKLNGSTETELTPWTASSAIIPYGWNTLTVVAVGKSLKFYINDTLVSSVNDSSFKTGQVGLGFYRTASSGRLYVTYAKLNTTATADSNINEEVAPGIVLPGGSSSHAP